MNHHKSKDRRRPIVDFGDGDQNILSLKEVLSNRIFQLANVYIAESTNDPDIDKYYLLIRIKR